MKAHGMYFLLYLIFTTPHIYTMQEPDPDGDSVVVCNPDKRNNSPLAHLNVGESQIMNLINPKARSHLNIQTVRISYRGNVITDSAILKALQDLKIIFSVQEEKLNGAITTTRKVELPIDDLAGAFFSLNFEEMVLKDFYAKKKTTFDQMLKKEEPTLKRIAPYLLIGSLAMALITNPYILQFGKHFVKNMWRIVQKR